MCVEVKSDYQKPSRLKSLFRAMRRIRFLGIQDTPEKCFWDLPGGPGACSPGKV